MSLMKVVAFEIPISQTCLSINSILLSGQSFRWRLVGEGVFRGVMRSCVVTLRQSADSNLLQCSLLSPSHEAVATPEGGEKLIRDYFQLNVPLEVLYAKWSDIDKNFANKAQQLKGIRILRQDPVENLFSFICSQNNHITRISSLVEKLCSQLGDHLCDDDGVSYYAFPSVQQIAAPNVEETLRSLGFGYRAKYIHQAAKYIFSKGGAQWLLGLRTVSYESARQELMQIPGIGPKVADCVCLMSLDKPNAMPVDTHVWQIAKRDYHLTGTEGHKTLTSKSYSAVAQFFQQLYGEYAGWAQTVLFCADLKAGNTSREKAIDEAEPPSKRRKGAKAKVVDGAKKKKKKKGFIVS